MKSHIAPATHSFSARLAAVGANCVLIFHGLFALIAVFGSLLILIDVRLAIIHLLTVAWSSVVHLASWTCPLTPLEKRLRAIAGQSVYEGGWVQHYLEGIIKTLGISSRLDTIVGVVIVIFNIVLYSIVWYMFYHN